MKRLLGALGLATVAASVLSGCYYEPDYGYVRGGSYQGSAYYGRGPATVVEQDYYGSGWYTPGWYEPGWYGYPSGVSVGVSGVWYDGGHRRRGHDWDRREWNERHVERRDRDDGDRHDGDRDRRWRPDRDRRDDHGDGHHHHR